MSVKKSFAERVAALPKSQDAASLPEGRPMPYFFRGVSAVTGSGYPDWVCEKLRQEYKFPPTYPFAYMVSMAEKYIREEDQDENGDGYGLMYRLLIEPFHMIKESEVDTQ